MIGHSRINTLTSHHLDFKNPPLLEYQIQSNLILRFLTSNVSRAALGLEEPAGLG
jgi:hypothetical protein